jgi:hypothetical protein
MAAKQESRSDAVGKNKDDRYVQTNVYLPKEVKAAVKIELLRSDGELSELVETLLRDWLKGRGVKVPAMRKTGQK